jgi:maltooligosyltrehalose trehalohydrolase
MRYRGRPRGEPSGDLPPTAFVAFIQNHDQVGNRAFGDRLSPGAPMRAIAAVYLLAPQIPMIFMGEEWAAAEPFPFFSDLGPALAAGVREGRRAEFARFPEFQDPAQQERIPDPTAADTFLAAKLNRRDAGQGTHAEWRNRYRRMLAVRHTEIVPRLGGARGGAYEILGRLAVRVRWPLDGDAELVLLANLKADPVSGIAPVEGRVLWSEGIVEADSLGAWSVVWMLRDGQ